MSIQELRARHPELENITPFTVEWHRVHRDAHLRMFPDSDQATRDNLDDFVKWAEEREPA